MRKPGGRRLSRWPTDLYLHGCTYVQSNYYYRNYNNNIIVAVPLYPFSKYIILKQGVPPGGNKKQKPDLRTSLRVACRKNTHTQN